MNAHNSVTTILLFHFGTSLPCGRRIAFGLYGNSKNTLFPESRVQCQHAHQHKIGQHANDQNRATRKNQEIHLLNFRLNIEQTKNLPRFWKWILMIPTKCQQCNSNGKSTYGQAAIDQTKIFRTVGSTQQCSFYGIIDGMFNGRTIPFVYFDHLKNYTEII